MRCSVYGTLDLNLIYPLPVSPFLSNFVARPGSNRNNDRGYHGGNHADYYIVGEGIGLVVFFVGCVLKRRAVSSGFSGVKPSAMDIRVQPETKSISDVVPFRARAKGYPSRPKMEQLKLFVCLNFNDIHRRHGPV